MRKPSEIKELAKRDLCVLALVAGVGGFCASFPAQAEDNPFEFDAGNWVSSQTYNDNLLRRPPPPEQGKSAEEEPENKMAAAAPAPEVKPPPRPPMVFSTPVLPGLNKGFNVQVSSTDDIDEKTTPTPAAAPDAAPDIRLPDKNWAPPSEKSLMSKAHNGENDGQEASPLNVRMTFLPSQNVVPITSPEHESAEKKAHALLKKLAEEKKKTPAKTPEEAAACAALDAYKQQQLDAIQSDRQTLKALQDAIHSLGLGKKLDFMSQQGSTLIPAGP